MDGRALTDVLWDVKVDRPAGFAVQLVIEELLVHCWPRASAMSVSLQRYESNPRNFRTDKSARHAYQSLAGTRSGFFCRVVEAGEQIQHIFRKLGSKLKLGKCSGCALYSRCLAALNDRACDLAVLFFFHADAPTMTH